MNERPDIEFFDDVFEPRFCRYLLTDAEDKLAEDASSPEQVCNGTPLLCDRVNRFLLETTMRISPQSFSDSSASGV